MQIQWWGYHKVVGCKNFGYECLHLVKLSLFLPPANVVCEGYVFTGICLSTRGAWVAGGPAWCGGGACVTGGVYGRGGCAW